MITAGWSDHAVARQVLAMLQSWMDLLEKVAREAQERFGSLGPFTASDVATLVGLSFLGAESMILLGDADWAARVRACLRRVGELLRELEEGAGSA
jgi:hypothetical protein